MDQNWWTWVVAIAGVAVGAVGATVVFRGRLQDILAAAVAHGRSQLQTEIGALSERLASAQAEALQLRQERLTWQSEGESLRRSLEALTLDQARLTERASRVTSLESETARLTLQLRMTEEELRRLAASEAQKAQALASLSEQARRLERDEAHIDQVLAPIRMELSDLRQRLLQVLGARRLTVEGVRGPD